MHENSERSWRLLSTYTDMRCFGCPVKSMTPALSYLYLNEAGDNQSRWRMLL